MLKDASNDEDDKQKSKPKKAKRFQGGSAYPAYDRALTTQFRRSPHAAGVQRALGTGGLGAILGALATRLVTKNPALIGGGAALGGLATGIPGYQSGRDEAKSDYSRLLFLRRRMGVNDPGELEALLRHPEIAAASIKQGMSKEAKLGALAKILMGAGIGGGIGYYGTPHLGGYADVEPARRASAVIDATLGGIIGGLGHRAGGMGRMIRGISPKAMVAIPTAAGAGEMVPISMATMARTREAMESMSDAGKSLAESSKVTSIPYNLRQVLSTPAARGAGIGAAAAGIGGILTGLARRKSEEEVLKHKSRGSMMTTDALKYLLPAMLAGGVAGSLKRNTDTVAK